MGAFIKILSSVSSHIAMPLFCSFNFLSTKKSFSLFSIPPLFWLNTCGLFETYVTWDPTSGILTLSRLVEAFPRTLSEACSTGSLRYYCIRCLTCTSPREGLPGLLWFCLLCTYQRSGWFLQMTPIYPRLQEQSYISFQCTCRTLFHNNEGCWRQLKL